MESKKPELSDIVVNEIGQIGECYDYGQHGITFYKINGVTEHHIWGIFLSFNKKFETN